MKTDDPLEPGATAGTAAARVEAPLVPLYVAGVYREAPAGWRAALLECLMRPVGVLGLVAVAGGVFAAVRQRHGWDRLQVTLEDTARISAEQVLELCAYLQQTTPEALRQAGELVAQQPALATSGVSAALLLGVLRLRLSPPAGCAASRRSARAPSGAG